MLQRLGSWIALAFNTWRRFYREREWRGVRRRMGFNQPCILFFLSFWIIIEPSTQS